MVVSQNFFVFYYSNGLSDNYRARCCRMGYRTDMSVVNDSNSARGGEVSHLWCSAKPGEKVLRDMGHRNYRKAKSRDMGPLSP